MQARFPVPEDAEEDSGLILMVTEKGESFWSVAMLSKSRGLYHPLIRRNRKGSRPDLFDTGHARISRPKQGELIFLSEYQPTRRRTGIAKSYERLTITSRFAEIIRKNAQHLPEPASVFALSEQFFNSIESEPAPKASYLKTLYLLAKNEGLPVREDWVSGLGQQGQRDLASILRKSLAEQPDDTVIFDHLMRSLEDWLVREAHFSIPGIFG